MRKGMVALVCTVAAGALLIVYGPDFAAVPTVAACPGCNPEEDCQGCDGNCLGELFIPGHCFQDDECICLGSQGFGAGWCLLEKCKACPPGWSLSAGLRCYQSEQTCMDARDSGVASCLDSCP